MCDSKVCPIPDVMIYIVFLEKTSIVVRLTVISWNKTSPVLPELFRGPGYGGSGKINRQDFAGNDVATGHPLPG